MRVVAPLQLNRAGWRWPGPRGPVLAGVGTLGLAGLLLTQSPFIVIGLVIGLAGLLLVTRRPEWGLYLLVLSVPGQVATSLTVGGNRVTFTQVALLLALAGWLGSRVVYRHPLVPAPLPRLLPLFGLYLFVMLLSLLVARNTGEGLAELYRWAVTTVAYWLATSVIQTRRQLWGLVICLCAGSVLEAAVGVIQTRLNLGPESYAISEDLSRAFGTFDKPNSFAGYLEMGLPLLAAMSLLAWHFRGQTVRGWLAREGQPRVAEYRAMWKYHRYLAALVPAVGLVSLGVLASFSRGAWLGLATAAVAMVLLRGRKSIPIVLVGVITLTLVVLGLQTGAIPASTFGRLTSIGDQFQPFDVRDVTVNDDNFAIVERMAMWQAGGNMVLSNPWLGVGIGNYNERYTEFSTPRWPDSRGHAHNYYIHAAAETGFIGLTAYLLLLLTAIVQAVRVTVRASDPARRYVAWGATGVILAVAVHNIVEDLHVLNMGIQWSAVLALFYLLEQPAMAQSSGPDGPAPARPES